MSKTPTPNEARTALQRLRENVANDDLIAALDVAIDHLPKPVLADGPYLYRAPDGRAPHVRFVRDGRSTVYADERLAAAGLGREIEDPECYEPIIIVRGGGDLPPDLVGRVANRTDMARNAVRAVLNALVQEVCG